MEKEGFGRTMYQRALKKSKLPRRSSDSHSHISKDSTAQNNHQNNFGAVEAGAPSVEKDVASLKKPTDAPPSSFEFYVWSDEGINLDVDLNSSPSDWTQRFKKEVCITENVHENESWSLWQDLGCLGESSTQRKSSFLQNSNSRQIKNFNGQTKFPSSLKWTKGDVTGLDQQDKDGSPLISDTLMPLSMTGNVADNLKDTQIIVSAERTVNMAKKLKEGQSTGSGYGAPFISRAESCSKDASKEILNSDYADTPLIKSVCGSIGNSLADPGKLDFHNSKPGNVISEDYTLLNGSCFVNPGVVCPGVSVCSSAELQISEVASCHRYASVSLCENDGSLELIDPKNILDTEQGGLVNSSKFNLDTDENNFLSLTEEWEVGKIVNGRESSECSQFDDPLKKSGPESADRDCQMKLHKKRKQIGPDVQGSSGKPVTKILRRMKYIAGMVLPRRSMRLISKGL